MTDRSGGLPSAGRAVAAEFDHDRAEAAVRELLIAIGEDPEREGLRETPARVARAYAELTRGHAPDAARTCSPPPSTSATTRWCWSATSSCGRCASTTWCRSPASPTSATSPTSSGKITGLSKLARLVDVYAKRPQVQERLTTQVADALMEILEARGVIVVIEAEHLCMTMRGVRKAGARTITSAVRGIMHNAGHPRRGDGADHTASRMSPWTTVVAPGCRRCPRPLVMGVVNVTPDSFSDGGLWDTTEAAIAHGRELLRRGRRPARHRRGVDPPRRHPAAGRRGARPGGPGHRAARRGRRRRSRWTRCAARWPRPPLEAGARCRQRRLRRPGRPRDPRVVAAHGVTYVAMHWRAHSDEMQELAVYDPRRGGRRPRRAAPSGSRRPSPPGSPSDRLVVDPGLGFAKTAEQNWELLRALDELAALGRPLLVGSSRKSFLGSAAGRRPGHRVRSASGRTPTWR